MARAAFFDLDKTVIARSSALAFGRPFFQGGLINRRDVLRSTFAQLVFMVSGADEDQVERMRAHITAMCTGWDVVQVREIVEEALHEIVDPLIYAEAAELIEAHRALGDEIVIVSASGAEVVTPIGRMLGADEVIATRMVVADGRYTGVIDSYMLGPAKAVAMTALAAERGWDLSDCHAYSDSVTDVPMLEAVGHPTVVNPDRALRRIAVERGWPQLSFTNPVSLRARLGDLQPPPRPVLAGAAVGVGAAAAGLTWLLRHRAQGRADPGTGAPA